MVAEPEKKHNVGPIYIEPTDYASFFSLVFPYFVFFPALVVVADSLNGNTV